jgi:hypothetical protein
MNGRPYGAGKAERSDDQYDEQTRNYVAFERVTELLDKYLYEPIKPTEDALENEPKNAKYAFHW